MRATPSTRTTNSVLPPSPDSLRTDLSCAVSNFLKPLDFIRGTCLNPFRRIQQVRKNKKTNNASEEEQFPVGTRVKHAGRGLGTVTQIMEDGRTVVTFDDPKKGMHRYKRTAMHKLEKVSASGIVPVELKKLTSAAVDAAKQSTSTLAVVLGLKTIAVEQERTYSSKERAMAAFLQTFKKTQSLPKAIGARARLRAKLIEGVQFAQQDTYGVQGNSQFKIGLVRGRTQSHETFTATIEVSRTHASTLVEGQDFILPSKQVTFFPGQRFASITVELLDTPVRMAGDVNKAWLPIREAVFALSAGPDQDPNAFGVATECRLKIVDKDPWPTAAEQKRSTYMTYVMMIFRANLEKELNWLVGVLLRGINGKIIKNILFIVLFDVAVLHRSLDWAFVVGACYLLCELIDHVTSYWYNSGWALGYNVPMTWVLAKWAQLPAVAVADVDTIEKYRIVTELIATDFFSKNTYSAFTGLISTCVDIVLITIAPIVLFNLDFCSRRDSNGICTLYDSVGFAYTEETFNLSIIVAGGTVAAVCVYFVVDAFTKKPTRYEKEVQKWVELEGKFHLSEQDLLNNTALHRNFEKQRVELSSTITNMSTARDQKATYLLALDTAGTSFNWMIKFVYIGIMLAAPVRQPRCSVYCPAVPLPALAHTWMSLLTAAAPLRRAPPDHRPAVRAVLSRCTNEHHFRPAAQRARAYGHRHALDRRARHPAQRPARAPFTPGQEFTTAARAQGLRSPPALHLASIGQARHRATSVTCAGSNQ